MQNKKPQQTEEKENNVHKNHRQRMREKYLSGGIDSFADHEILELLLFFAIPRVNTNPIAHELIKKFKTLDGVFSASYEELKTVKGMGKNAAFYIRLLQDFRLRMQKSDAKKRIVLKDKKTIGDYVVNFFLPYKYEVLFAFFLDKGDRLISWELIEEGAADEITVNPVKILRQAVRNNAVSVILAHNHPGGNHIASAADAAVTQRISVALRAVGITLKEHVVVAGEKYSAVSELGYDCF